MSRLFLFLSLLFATLQVSAQQHQVRYNQADQRVLFSPEMNKESLEKLRSSLTEHAITLHYQDLKFGPGGGLVAISFTVKDSSGRTFEAGTVDLATAGFFGFEFGFVDGKSTVLNVGTLDELAVPPVKP